MYIYIIHDEVLYIVKMLKSLANILTEKSSCDIREVN